MHVSFQSTGVTNIQSVNCFNENMRFVKKRERRQKNRKRKWVIEMNNARQVYLFSYGRIDTIDAAIGRCNLNYVSWKYRYAAKLHCDALALVVAYDMYHECATEALARDAFSITNEDKFKVLDFNDLCSMAASKILTYNIDGCKYPGDEKMRKNTRVAKTRRNTTSIKKGMGYWCKMKKERFLNGKEGDQQRIYK